MASVNPASELDTFTPPIEYVQRKGVPGTIEVQRKGVPGTIEIGWDVTNFHSTPGKQERKIAKGGIEWSVLYYPNGHTELLRGHLGVFFKPVNCKQDVEITTYTVKIKLGEQILIERSDGAHVFRRGEGQDWGFHNFGNAASLPDSFQLCFIVKIKNFGETHLPLPNMYKVEVPALLKMFCDQTNTDVTVKCMDGKNNYEIRAHCSLLSAFSPVFSAMLNGEWAEKRTKTINVQENISEEVMTVFVRMFYGATIEAETFAAAATQLFALSSLYNVESLQNICAEWITKTLSIESAVETLLVADRFEAECPTLKAAALEFIVENAKDVMGHESYTLLLKYEQTRLLSHLNIALANTINSLTSRAPKRKRSTKDDFITRAIEGMTQNALRNELQRRNLSTGGLKAQLVARLKAAIAAECKE